MSNRDGSTLDEPRRCADCERWFYPNGEDQDYCFPCWREIRLTRVEPSDPWRQWSVSAGEDVEGVGLKETLDRLEEAAKEVEKLRRMPYAEYLRTQYWQELRKECLRRAEYRCQRCRKPGPSYANLHLHHLTYERRGHEQISDLIVLCSRCHEGEHKL